MDLIKLEEMVEAKIGDRALSSIVSYVEECKPTLWGSQQGHHFIKFNVLLTIYKDLSGFGYGHVLKLVNLRFSFSQVSFQHNARLVRPLFKRWAKSIIQIGDASKWNNARRRCEFPSGLNDVSLWIDSSDFSIQCPAGPKRKNPYYSHKNLALARRYMMIADAKGRIRKIWGGYSPKVYDGHWLEINREWIDDNMTGGVVVGDCHFAAGKTMFENVTFFTPHPKKWVPKNEDGEGLVKLTKEQIKWNAALAHVRVRIEQPFGWIKSNFASLSQKWAENPTQQDNTVWFAAAVYN